MSKNDSKLFALIGVIPLIGWIIVLLARKKDSYAMHYAKQGLILFIAAVIVGIASWATGWVPLVGWLVEAVLKIGWFILFVFGIVYSLSGKKQYIPLIGNLF
ncbi:MAG TPA: DUF4870 domain-containing protein [Alphaproteobacteria bacterium]|nr:DUF4870 domain-containing protein [Alphaproteobacteria bacterium]